MSLLERVWWDRDAAPALEALLWPLSLASLGYRAGAALHRRFAQRVRAQVPVISVGNFTVGGAGKTPVVLELARRLLERGRRPAVLSRGYGRTRRDDLEVSPGTSTADGGDEPVLLARRLPGLRVFVGAKRARLASRAVAGGADVLLLDDGLQHHALERDLDVVVVDGSNPLGNGRLLPRGPLRESPAAALARARRPLVWLTRADLPRDERAPAADVESAYVPAGADGLRGARVFLFAGIARPASFEATARPLAGSIAGARFFPDHFRYGARELALVRREAQRAGADLIATTEKDFVRLDPRDLAGTPPIVPVPVSVRITRGEEALSRALSEALGR